jgi:hypothetical protein
LIIARELECSHFEGEIAGIVDKLPPEFAGLPPSIIRFPIPKTQQHADEDAVDHRQVADPLWRLPIHPIAKELDTERIEQHHDYRGIEPFPHR